MKLLSLRRPVRMKVCLTNGKEIEIEAKALRGEVLDDLSDQAFLMILCVAASVETYAWLPTVPGGLYEESGALRGVVVTVSRFNIDNIQEEAQA